MESFQRSQVAILSQRLAEVPHRLISLFGPRQTGKTTIVLQALQGISPACRRYLAVDEPEYPHLAIRDGRTASSFPLTQVRDRNWLVRNWEQARLDAERAGRFVLVFDEIQKIPQWSETVKGLWDADRARNCPLHVVILGSAPLLMQSGLNESLAGRFEPIRVTHWSFDEMSECLRFRPSAVSLFRRLSRGRSVCPRPEPMAEVTFSVRWLSQTSKKISSP